MHSSAEQGQVLFIVTEPASAPLQAEVQSLHADGSIALHTRSAKYGKVGILQSQQGCVKEAAVKVTGGGLHAF